MADWEPVARSYDALKAGSIDGTDTVPHDKAIWRAMNAKYKPNKDVVGIPENTIFVGRLNLNTDEETLEDCFGKYGKIKRLRLVRDIVTGFSKGYAFVEYGDEDTAFRAQKYLDKTPLDEKEMYVDFECERTLEGWRPRRLGGGISGKKESGQLRFGGKSRPFKKPFNVENVIQPEGSTFRDRLRAVDEGYRGGRDRERDDRGRDRYTYRDRFSGRDRQSDRERYSDRDRYSDSRDRHSDRGSSGKRDRDRSRERESRGRKGNRRSRSRDRTRSRSRERRK